MTEFMRKANNKVTDDMRRAHFLNTDPDFGDVATHVAELLRTYNVSGNIFLQVVGARTP